MATIADVAMNYLRTPKTSNTQALARGFIQGQALKQRESALDQSQQELALKKESMAQQKALNLSAMAKEEQVELAGKRASVALMAETPEKWKAIQATNPALIPPEVGFDQRDVFIAQHVKAKDIISMGKDAAAQKWKAREFGLKEQQFAETQWKNRQPQEPLVQVNTGTAEPPYKVEQGFMLKDPDDYTKGVTPIPGGSKDKLTPEQAGKTQMMRTAKKQYDKAFSLVFGKDGEPDWMNITNAWANTPKTKGRELATAMEYGIQAITRMETGAAMPADEVRNTRKRFQPTPGDTNEAVKIKMEMFNDFINGTLKLIDPSGRFDEERFQSELESRQGGSPKVNPVEGIQFLGFE